MLLRGSQDVSQAVTQLYMFVWCSESASLLVSSQQLHPAGFVPCNRSSEATNLHVASELFFC